MLNCKVMLNRIDIDYYQYRKIVFDIIEDIIDQHTKQPVFDVYTNDEKYDMVEPLIKTAVIPVLKVVPDRHRGRLASAAKRHTHLLLKGL